MRKEPGMGKKWPLGRPVVSVMGRSYVHNRTYAHPEAEPRSSILRETLDNCRSMLVFVKPVGEV